MSGLQGDGYAHYGTGATSVTNMQQGVYAQVGTGVTCETTNPRGDGTHHLRWDTATNSSNGILRRVLAGGSISTIQFAAAYYFSALPASNDAFCLFVARNGSNAAQFSVMVTSTGTIAVRNGDHTGSVVAETLVPVLVAGAYQHLELIADVGNTGAIEIRVNEVTVLNESGTGIDIQAQGTSDVAQWVVGITRATPNLNVTIDVTDVVVCDDAGAVNNTFLGDVQALPWRVTADTATTDWVRNTGSDDYAAIDDVTPDGDTTYIDAATPGDVSEFELDNVPATTSDILFVVTQPMIRKTDAGSGSVQMALVSPGASPDAVASGAVKAVTEVYTYYPEVFELDPATGIQWTPSNWNAARLRFTRTA